MKSDRITFDALSSNQDKTSFSFKELEHEFKKLKGDDFNINQNVLTTLNLIENDKLNLAAEILSDNPPRDYATLDMVRFGETISIFLDRRTIKEASLIKQYNEGLSMFDKWYQPYEEVVGFYREERIHVPREAFREALVNALVHQDLSINASVQVAMHSDKIKSLLLVDCHQASQKNNI